MQSAFLAGDSLFAFVNAVPPLTGYVLGDFLGRTLHLSFLGPCQPKALIIFVCSRSGVLILSLYSVTFCVIWDFK